VCRRLLFKWGKGENSTNGWRARIEDRGSHVTEFSITSLNLARRSHVDPPPDQIEVYVPPTATGNISP
jgi:hypothetical protein